MQPRRLTISPRRRRRSFEGRLIATDLPRHRDQRRTTEFSRSRCAKDNSRVFCFLEGICLLQPRHDLATRGYRNPRSIGDERYFLRSPRETVFTSLFRAFGKDHSTYPAKRKGSWIGLVLESAKQHFSRDRLSPRVEDQSSSPASIGERRLNFQRFDRWRWNESNRSKTIEDLGLFTKRRVAASEAGKSRPALASSEFPRERTK